MVVKWVVALAIIVVSCGGLGADECKCGGKDKVVGPSFKVHGRLRAANGFYALQIWVIGTKHKLGMDEYSQLPANLNSVFKPFENEVFGDFVVCPLSEDTPGQMQLVCVKSATHLVVKEFEQ